MLERYENDHSKYYKEKNSSEQIEYGLYLPDFSLEFLSSGHQWEYRDTEVYHNVTRYIM